MSSLAASPLVMTDEVVRLAKERDVLRARIEEIETKLTGIRAWLGEARYDELIGGGDRQHDEGPSITWTEALTEAITSAPDGITYAQIRDFIRQGPLADSLVRSPNNFFNGISRLIRTEAAVKIGEYLFTPAAAACLTEGDRERLAAVTDGRSGTPGLVLRILAESDVPLSPGQIVDAVLKADPTSKQSRVYAALSRLSLNEDVIRGENGRYRLPDQSVEQTPDLLD